MPASIRDRRLAATIRRLHELKGQRLFQYRDAAGDLRPVGSGDVNAYLRQISGRRFTAKDFRTFAGTAAAAVHLAALPAPRSVTEARRTIAACMREVASQLGNTPSVCRKAYVHPGVLSAYESGAIPSGLAAVDDPAMSSDLLKFLRRIQRQHRT